MVPCVAQQNVNHTFMQLICATPTWVFISLVYVQKKQSVPRVGGGQRVQSSDKNDAHIGLEWKWNIHIRFHKITGA